MHVILYESSNALQGRTGVNDDLGLEDYMGRLQIENWSQQEEREVDLKKERSPLALPPP